MGYCPEIIFVRDIFQENLINVERILNEVCSENIKEDTQPVSNHKLLLNLLFK